MFGAAGAGEVRDVRGRLSMTDRFLGNLLPSTGRRRGEGAYQLLEDLGNFPEPFSFAAVVVVPRRCSIDGT